MTDQPYAGATPEQLRHPMVRELLGIHNTFRNELVVMMEFIHELIAGEQQFTGAETQQRIRSLIQAGAHYTHMLHMHHHLETSALFPTLQAEGLEVPVIDRLNAEHDDIAVLIDQFNAAIHDLAAVEAGVIDSDLRRLAEALQAHLAYEETHICPLLARFSSWPTFNSVD